jgi:hypothetical protein
MKAIIEYGPFSTMIDVPGDGRPVYFPKPVGLAPMTWSSSNLDAAVIDNVPHKLEFVHKPGADIEYNGSTIQVYRFVGES